MIGLYGILLLLLLFIYYPEAAKNTRTKRHKAHTKKQYTIHKCNKTIKSIKHVHIIAAFQKYSLIRYSGAETRLRWRSTLYCMTRKIPVELRPSHYQFLLSAVFSFPESSFYLRSLIWTLLCVFLFIYCQNFFGLDLHSWKIFSCSWCKRLTVVYFTLLRMLLHSFSTASIFVLIQLFQSLCFFFLIAAVQQ